LELEELALQAQEHQGVQTEDLHLLLESLPWAVELVVE
jgi:hypothetical protein